MIANADRARLFKRARAMLARGENIINGLTQEENAPRTIAIEIAYALQSGSYTEYAKTETAGLSRREGHAILEPLLAEHGCKTMLDCGAGEGTRWLDFSAPLEHLALLEGSWARLTFASAIMAQVPAIASYQRIKGNMIDLPFRPGSFDAVFTSHAIEPNTDANARLIIDNLFAMARKLVVLFEPNFRDAHPAMKARMEQHGYACNIWDVAEAQAGFTRVASGNFEVSPNPDNRTSYLVMRRDTPMPDGPVQMRAPGSDTALFETPDGYQCVDGSFAYPVLGGIACLSEEDGVFLGTAPQELQ
ncbi:MAG: methyltransferase domain-containing protein [Pseudomonadota bacterium]